WSSDVCSSDLNARSASDAAAPVAPPASPPRFDWATPSSKPSKNDDHVGSTERGSSHHWAYLSSSKSALSRAETDEFMSDEVESAGLPAKFPAWPDTHSA